MRDTGPNLSSRDEYISVLETLPPGYLDGNAAPLLRAVEELRKSLTQEIVTVQHVKRVDPANPSEVKQLAEAYDDYRESRDESHDRSHCANIGRAMDVLRPPDIPLDKSDQQKIDRLIELMAFLRSADADFVFDSNRLVDDAAEVLNNMDKALDRGNVAEAERLHECFLAELKGRISALKDLLSRMNGVSNDLIDRLA